jgi:hypothetical protein
MGNRQGWKVTFFEDPSAKKVIGSVLHMFLKNYLLQRA